MFRGCGKSVVAGAMPLVRFSGTEGLELCSGVRGVEFVEWSSWIPLIF